MTWLPALVSTVCLAVYAWQDGIHDCNDGARYTSRKPQPPPFHRRFHWWPTLLLQAITLASLVALGALMGSPQKTLLLLALPGAWFVATHPTTTDAPCMLLAWAASTLLHAAHPVYSVALSLAAGAIHERGPVFAAVYAWHPLPLLGLLAVQWWARPAKRDADALVGWPTTWKAIQAHRPYQDLLDGKLPLYGLRVVLPAAVWWGASRQAWAALGLAMASRVLGTDTCRFLFWAAPPLVVGLPALPWWVVAVHLVTFQRAI